MIAPAKAPGGTNRRNPARVKAARIAGVRDLWKYPTTDAETSHRPHRAVAKVSPMDSGAPFIRRLGEATNRNGIT